MGEWNIQEQLKTHLWGLTSSAVTFEEDQSGLAHAEQVNMVS